MKNILIYYNWQLLLPFYGIMIDHINNLTKDKVNIFLLSCNGLIKNCLTNSLNDPNICSLCRFVKKSGLSSLNGNINHISLESFNNSKVTDITFSYNSLDEIKKLDYKNVKIGYGALSSYVSYTRNLEPIIDSDFRSYFDDFLYSQIRIIDSLEDLLNTIQIDEVHLYNGRWADVRPAYDFFKSKGIHVNVLESVNNGKDKFYKQIYPNVLPQDIEFRTKQIISIWEESELSESEKFVISEKFLSDKRMAISPREGMKIFTDQQIQILPDGFNSSKINISIFNSSEDEFVALGDEWEKFRIFNTQEQAIIEICEYFKNLPEYHFYLRVHPNLKGVQYGYVTRLHELQHIYDNLTVIKADSKISSYKLLDHSNKVIVFGSSIGFEASYSNKPIILLGGTLYYFLESTYIPKDTEELFALIGNKELPPKPKLGSYMFAFYLMNHKSFSELINLNPKPFYVLGKKIGHYFTFTKFLNSAIFFRLVYQAWLYFLSLSFIKSNKTIPNKGL
jgi:hypothetical protein